MARTGITYLDVAKAAETIQQQGHNPTVDRVLAHLGTGSKSTIAPLLKRWKSDQGDGTDTGGLPGDVLEAVKAMHERLQQVANDKISEAKKEHQVLLEELREQLDQAKVVSSRYELRIKDLEKTHEVLHNRNASLRDDLEAERVRSAKMEAALEESTNMLREAKDTIQEQKREIKQIRAHFEHYQTSVAEDRQLERKQNHSVKAELESRIRELIQQLQDERQRSQVFETKNQQTEHALVRLREEFDQVKQEHQALKLDAGRKEGALKRLESDTNAYKQQIEKLVAERDVLSTAKADLATANQLLVHDIARLKEEVSEAEDKITHLSNENKFVSQEKAVLQGQLKQIQGNR